MRKKLVGILFLSLILIFSNTVTANVAFHEGFEFNGSLIDNGYVIDNADDPNLIAETNSIAASTGARGLFMSSVLNSGAVSIKQSLGLPYSTEVYFSFHIYNISGNTNLRIILEDSNAKQLYLDYGPNGNKWENEFIFDVDQSFVQGDWSIVNRKLDTDIKTALKNPNTAFLEFEPVNILSLEIFQNGVVSNNSAYIDEITINPFGHELIENQNPTINGVNFSSISIFFAISSVLIVTKVIRRKAI